MYVCKNQQFGIICDTVSVYLVIFSKFKMGHTILRTENLKNLYISVKTGTWGLSGSLIMNPKSDFQNSKLPVNNFRHRMDKYINWILFVKNNLLKYVNKIIKNRLSWCSFLFLFVQLHVVQKKRNYHPFPWWMKLYRFFEQICTHLNGN